MSAARPAPPPPWRTALATLDDDAIAAQNATAGRTGPDAYLPVAAALALADRIAPKMSDRLWGLVWHPDERVRLALLQNPGFQGRTNAAARYLRVALWIQESPTRGPGWSPTLDLLAASGWWPDAGDLATYRELREAGGDPEAPDTLPPPLAHTSRLEAPIRQWLMASAGQARRAQLTQAAAFQSEELAKVVARAVPALDLGTIEQLLRLHRACGPELAARTDLQAAAHRAYLVDWALAGIEAPAAPLRAAVRWPAAVDRAAHHPPPPPPPPMACDFAHVTTLQRLAERHAYDLPADVLEALVVRATTEDRGHGSPAVQAGMVVSAALRRLSDGQRARMIAVAGDAGGILRYAEGGGPAAWDAAAAAGRGLPDVLAWLAKLPGARQRPAVAAVLRKSRAVDVCRPLLEDATGAEFVRLAKIILPADPERVVRTLERRIDAVGPTLPRAAAQPWLRALAAADHRVRIMALLPRLTGPAPRAGAAKR